MVPVCKLTPETPDNPGADAADTLKSAGTNDTPAHTGHEEAATDAAADGDDDAPQEHKPSAISYSAQFYADRPRALRPRARQRGQGAPAPRERVRQPVGTNSAYVE